MSTLQELKDKWFVDVSQGDSFPPQTRHRVSKIQPSSDGNLVESLIDGAAIMGDFHYRAEKMLNCDNPEDCLIIVAAMGIDPVKLLGENGPAKGGPTHDLALKVQGPAVADVVQTFQERWNDPSSAEGTSLPIQEAMPDYFRDLPIPRTGPHSVQVLRSFPLIKKRKGYSWSDQGEYTIWAAYLKAIKQAQQYIYIEDQYLFTFHDPPFFETSTGVGRDTDIVYQLGEALKRGVDVVALVPGRNNAIWKHYEIQQRRRAAEYLQGISAASPDHGEFVICKLHIDGKDPTIHSKLMLVDDAYTLAGSANICQRSIAYITELQLGVVDEQDRLAKELRLALWQEHLELDSPDRLLNPRDAVGEYRENAAAGKGRLRLLPAKRFKPEFPYRFLFNQIVDPYSGPERGS